MTAFVCRYLGFAVWDEGPVRGGYAVMEDRPSVSIPYEPGEDVSLLIDAWWRTNGHDARAEKQTEVDASLEQLREPLSRKVRAA